MGGILKGLLGSLVGTPTSGARPQQPLSDPPQTQNKPGSAAFGPLVETPTSGAAPQQPLSIEQVLHEQAKSIDDVDLSDRSGTDPLEAQNKSDSAEWQPILTAPTNRDLEVRVADPMGHYALMCPCKLNPEQGWINSWLQTPLSHHPVEWREWTEPLVKY